MEYFIEECKICMKIILFNLYVHYACDKTPCYSVILNL